MTEEPTRPDRLEAGSSTFKPAWQPDEIHWSFGPKNRSILWSAPVPDQFDLPHSRNENGPTTVGPQEITSPKHEPALLRRHEFGRRGLQPLSHWEGVVEEITDEGFRARLVHLVDGPPNDDSVEFTDFSFVDLSTESDRSLVQVGAIFYWTIGRARNAAGTVTNVSLVRFRRILSTRLYQTRAAQRHANELFEALGGSNGSDTPRP